jgi:tRNA A37 threonylcarbamoyladenosine synthetase subunit TsaC/SUA5/YrdC
LSRRVGAAQQAGGVQQLAVDDPGAVAAVVAALRAGEAVVLPTETVYGLAALPQHRELLLEL